MAIQPIPLEILGTKEPSLNAFKLPAMDAIVAGITQDKILYLPGLIPKRIKTSESLPVILIRIPHFVQVSAIRTIMTVKKPKLVDMFFTKKNSLGIVSIKSVKAITPLVLKNIDDKIEINPVTKRLTASPVKKGFAPVRSVKCATIKINNAHTKADNNKATVEL